MTCWRYLSSRVKRSRLQVSLLDVRMQFTLIWDEFLVATEKKLDSGGNERFLYGISEMQGWRICEYRIPLHSDSAFCNTLGILLTLIAVSDPFSLRSNGGRACSCSQLRRRRREAQRILCCIWWSWWYVLCLRISTSFANSTDLALGGSVARFAGKNVHKRLVTEDTYREKSYEEALKRAFLGTDEDLLAGA